MALIVLGLMLSLAAQAYSGFLYLFVPTAVVPAIKALDRFIDINLVAVFGRPSTVLLLMLVGFIAAYVLYWRSENARPQPQVSRRIAI